MNSQPSSGKSRVLSPVRPFASFLLACWLVALAGVPAGAALPFYAYPPDYDAISVRRYGAKGDGVTDDTKAILEALRNNSSNNVAGTRTIFFPEGTYRVSDTLAPRDPKGLVVCHVRFLGAGRDKTIIRLADNCPGFNNPAAGKYVIQTGNDPHGRNENGLPNSGFGNYIEHLTVQVGRGNPGAIGIRYDVANSGRINDVAIRGGTGADTSGLWGLAFYDNCGPGLVKNVTIEGFDVGIHFQNSMVSVNNNIAFEHIALSNQRSCGIYNQNKLSMWRDLASFNRCPAIQMADPVAAMYIFDAVFASPSPQAPAAIEAPHGGILHLRNARMTNYAKAIDFPGDDQDVCSSYIDEYTAPSPFHEMPWNSPNAGTLRLFVQDTPEYHSNNLGEWANAARFGATPNDETDDTAAFQQAIDSGARIIYCPYGNYVLSGDLIVRGAVRKLDLLFSQFSGSGRIIFGDLEGDCVILENICHDSGLGLVHNSRAAVAIVNHSSRATIETSGKARGPLFLENSGSNPTLKINGDGILLWVRQWNREFQHVDLTACTAWVFGDNVECKPRGGEQGRIKQGYVSPHYTVRNSLFEFVGCHDLQGFDHPSSDPPIYTLIDSEASILAAGSIRSGEKDHGHVANIIKDVKGSKVFNIGWVDRNAITMQENQRKFLIPLYVSRSTALARYPFPNSLASEDTDPHSTAGPCSFEAAHAILATMHGRDCLSFQPLPVAPGKASNSPALVLTITPDPGYTLDLSALTADLALPGKRPGSCTLLVTDDFTGAQREITCSPNPAIPWTTVALDLPVSGINRPVTLRLRIQSPDTPAQPVYLDNLAIHGLCAKKLASYHFDKNTLSPDLAASSLTLSPLAWQTTKATEAVTLHDGCLAISVDALAPDIAQAVANRVFLAFTIKRSNPPPSLSHLRFKARLQKGIIQPLSIYLQSSVNGFGDYHSIGKIDITPDSAWHSYDFPLGPQFKPTSDPAIEFRLYLTATPAPTGEPLLLDDLELLGDDK